MENHYTAVFEQVGEWWIGCVEELPGPVAQEKSLAAARAGLTRAVHATLRANRERARREAHGHEVIREILAIPFE